MENGSDYLLSISVKTWNKDTEDLYDFESKDITQTNINVDGNSSEFFLIKTGNQLINYTTIDTSIIKTETLKDLPFQDSSTKLFCHVIPSPKNSFDILSHFASSNIHWLPEERGEDIWLKLSNTEFTTIKIGDIIKLGRVRIKLSSEFPILSNSIHDDNTIITSSNINLEHINNIKHTHDPDTKGNELCDSTLQKDMCRICYRLDSDYENPLIAPCKCTGSMKYIHYKCLQSAISSKFTTLKTNNYTLITWKGFECEICLSEYPKYMIHKSKTYTMINYAMISSYSQYIIFDYFIYDDTKFKANRKGILIINNDQSLDGEITIGRTQTNQVKLKNISVSRIHCSLKISNGNVMIKDNGSKFGTLLYLQHKYTLVNSNNDSGYDNKVGILNHSNYYGPSCILSSGRFSIEFQISKSRNFFSNLFLFSCCRNKNLNDSSCVIDLNEESDEEDFVNKKQIVNNIYEDHILFIDAILQSIDPSPL